MGMFGSMKKGASIKEGYSQLKVGMSKEEVIELFGEPNSIKNRNGVEILAWWSREWKGYLRGGNVERRVEVEFENGLVTGYDGENIDESIW